MKEYIELDFIYELLDLCLANSNGAENYAYRVFKNEVDNAPNSVIARLQSGTWEYWAGNLAKCPVCGYEYTDLLECDNFCGKCGARLYGGKV